MVLIKSTFHREYNLALKIDIYYGLCIQFEWSSDSTVYSEAIVSYNLPTFTANERSMSACFT